MTWWILDCGGRILFTMTLFQTFVQLAASLKFAEKFLVPLGMLVWWMFRLFSSCYFLGCQELTWSIKLKKEIRRENTKQVIKSKVENTEFVKREKKRRERVREEIDGENAAAGMKKAMFFSFGSARLTVSIWSDGLTQYIHFHILVVMLGLDVK